MIRFNVPPYTGNETENIRKAVENQHICGDGEFTRKCSEYVEEITGTAKCLLTTSCTHALEMAALLCDLKEGDEVILPSYTFVSTANAFVLRGAVPVFVDIRPDTMNIDENLIEAAVTERTKAIAVVHYAGIACEMDKIMEIAEKYHLMVVEDAAQAIMCSYKGKPLGTFGEFGCFSFHETKNFSMGEGGALLIREKEYIEDAEILREKGTDRSKYYRGQVDKYRWMNYGSSYLPSDINAAYLYSQFEMAEQINEARKARWNQYYELLMPLEERGLITLPIVPEGCEHNGHMFYIKTKDGKEREALIDFMKKNDILTVSHYVPLHSAPAGLRFSRFHGEDRYTTIESERLLRLPMFYQLTEAQVELIAGRVKEFYGV
ncbi:MAG: dTDP-4-amino-4,6-dideoxygalactose transaminase [Lachnospiraceae bacterium]|nr:dTDP-4-amino-4,6-dideoxygalactose transaminase [Lachnospiraceae bacterium]